MQLLGRTDIYNCCVTIKSSGSYLTYIKCKLHNLKTLCKGGQLREEKNMLYIF